MRTIAGDLIALAKAGRFDVIAHGCNCFHTMGGGLAAQMRRHFPAAYDADLATAYGDRGKLGTCSAAVVPVPGGPVLAGALTVVNAYTQFQPSMGGGGVDVDYDAVRHGMAWLKAHYAGSRFGLPQIGAGLAGGDWTRIEAIIARELFGEDVSIVIFSGAT
jgi:O-acetyl-ADP-ribose deacetylase (regulator of RNase III)